MYIPPAFEITDREILHDFIRSNSFAILFSEKEGHPFATHLPFLLDDELGSNGCLYGHMARANPHWRQMDDKAQKKAQKEVLVVFSGPHAYISPTWYEAQLAVPTWNYVTVHVYGKFQLIHEKEAVYQLLKDTVDYYESSFEQPWSLNQTDGEYVDQLSKGIVAFKIEITKIEGKWKLSQNHPRERQVKVARALSALPGDQGKQIGELMKRNLAVK